MRPDSGVWERRRLYSVLVGKLVGAEVVGTQRRRKKDHISWKGQVVASYEKGYAFSRSIKYVQFLTTSGFSRRTLLHFAHLRHLRVSQLKIWQF